MNYRQLDEDWDSLLKIKTMGRDDSISNNINFPYEPTNYSVLDRLYNEGYIRKTNCLLDYGCGKGRVGFYMSYQARCKSIGVDYDERMIQGALKNRESAVSGNRTEFVCENANEYAVPTEVDRIYFFNPFSAEILQQTLAKVRESYYEKQRGITGGYAMTEAERREAARQFYYTWNGRGDEKSDSQSFWLNLLTDVLGMEDAANRVVFEKRVIVDGQTKYIDVFIPESKVLIEQKSLGKELSKEITQSGGTELTPYQQAKRYSDNLPFDEKPRWIVVSNFAEIRIHDMNTREPEKEFISINLKDIQSEYHRLKFLLKEED